MNRGGMTQKMQNTLKFPPGKGLKIAGTHASEDYCNEHPSLI